METKKEFKYRIFYIQILGGIFSKKVEIFTNDVELERKEYARTFKVAPSKVKFKYDLLTEKWDDLKYPIPLEK